MTRHLPIEIVCSYINSAVGKAARMYEWGSRLRANLAKHGVAFDEVEKFNWSEALETQDGRFDYPEPRFVAIGPIGLRIHVLIFTRRRDRIRVISLRRATPKERKGYAKAKAKGR